MGRIQRYKDLSNVNTNTCRSYLHDQFILLEMMVRRKVRGGGRGGGGGCVVGLGRV